jgi:hypothetical protein
MNFGWVLIILLGVAVLLAIHYWLTATTITGGITNFLVRLFKRKED